MKLSPNFSLEELCVTSNVALQGTNLIQAKSFLGPLTILAETLERIRAFLGAPILIHSGYRCPELNGAIAGSAKTSQHMKGEAADFSCPDKFHQGDEGNRELFKALRDYLTTRAVPFGQLIDEGYERSYGTVVWIHFSLGAPWREAARCGQLLRMRNGKFEMLGVIQQP